MNKRKAKLIDELLEDCKTQEDVFGKDGLVKQLVICKSNEVNLFIYSSAFA